MLRAFRPSPTVSALWSFFLAAGTIIGCFLLLDHSTFYSQLFDPFVRLTPARLFLNLGSIAIILTLFLLLTNRVWLSCLLCSGVCSCIAVINYYVILLHGMPLSFLLIKNLRTAVNVISGVVFEINPRIITLVICAGLLCLLCLIYGLLVEEVLPRRRFLNLRNGILLALCALVVVKGYMGSDPIKPKKCLSWSWEEAYANYGYIPCTIESFFQIRDVVNRPDSYDQTTVDALSLSVPASAANNPDIILILNETFYDLSQITDIAADADYFPNLRSMENLLQGYAVVPSVGGGTNSSEYELLTSNSLQLMPGITPFNALDLDGANSIVSHLAALGYATTGSHSEPASNYGRGVGYKALGFENVYFDKQFQNQTYLYDRPFETDESLYQNMNAWHEASAQDRPRFSYLLTIQNHVGWDFNAPEYDTIHTTRDYGTNTQPVNEFLSTLSVSDTAFKDLTDYYAQISRPTIICMVGDHAPNFASAIADSSLSDAEAALRLRTVPLLIWANFPLDEAQKDLGTMSMNMVVPTLLDIADVPLSPYYAYLLQVKQQAPVVSSYGVYYDTDGNRHTYQDDTDSALARLVDNYFCLEYQNIVTDLNRDVYLPSVSPYGE